jgi:hypothetical protein
MISGDQLKNMTGISEATKCLIRSFSLKTYPILFFNVGSLASRDIIGSGMYNSCIPPPPIRTPSLGPSEIVTLLGKEVVGASVVDVLDYSATTKYKTTRLLSATEQNGTTGRIYFMSNLWQNTAAITSVTIIPTYGTAFSEYSSFALYGVK